MLNKEYIQKMLNQGKSLLELCEENKWNYHNTYYWCKKNKIILSRKNNGKSAKTISARHQKIKISSQNDIEKIKKNVFN